MQNSSHAPAPRLWRLLCLAAAACGLAACGNLMGDDDGVPTPDGRIVDPGGVALLAVVLGLLGVRQRRA